MYSFNNLSYGGVCQQATPNLETSSFAGVTFEELARRFPGFCSGVILYMSIEGANLLKCYYNTNLVSRAVDSDA